MVVPAASTWTIGSTVAYWLGLDAVLTGPNAARAGLNRVSTGETVPPFDKACSDSHAVAASPALFTPKPKSGPSLVIGTDALQPVPAEAACPDEPKARHAMDATSATE